MLFPKNLKPISLNALNALFPKVDIFFSNFFNISKFSDVFINTFKEYLVNTTRELCFISVRLDFNKAQFIDFYKLNLPTKSEKITFYLT